MIELPSRIWEKGKSNHLLDNWIIRENEEQKDNREVVIYGIEILISDVVNLFVVLLTGLVFGRVLCSLVFFASFAALRERTGGYHADTHLKCNIVLAINTILVMLVIKWFSAKDNIVVIVIAAAVLSGIVILVFAPVDNVNKKIDDSYKRKLKKQSIIAWGVMSIGIVFVVLIGLCDYSLAIASGMLSTAIALLVS